MWYQSAMNYDMMSPNPWNTMNLHMNQLWDHSAAWNNMFSVPQYSFDNFMPYGNMYGNSYLTNPFYSLNQMSWGTPAFNNMPWNNGGNMGNMWSPFGWNGGSFNGNNNGNSNTDSTTSRKYNRLLTFMKQLVKYEDGLSASQIDALNDAMRNAKGTTEEKYEKLLDAYNEIDKDTIRDFLAENGHKLGVSSDVKGSDKSKDTFYKRLLNTGFEYESVMDDEVEKFYDEIKTLKGSDGKSEDIEGIIGLINNGTYDILDFISSWNNNYKDDSESARVIDHIKKYYDDIDDKEQKADAKKLILKPFVEELIDKANSVKKVLDKDSKEAIEEAISDVREALNNTDESVDGNLSDAFDKLYLYTRQGAMAEFRNDAKAYYGEIDDEVFNDKLFVDEMIKDLESEGFSSSEIEDTEVAISERRAKRASRSKDDDDEDDNGSSSSSKMKNIDNKPAVQQISALKDEGIITELTTVKKDGTITLYQENKMTGDSDGDGKADYAKLFYINAEGKLVEWKNAKLDADGKLVSGIGETTAKPSEMAKAKKDIEKAEKEEKKKQEDAESIDATDFGTQTATKLGSWTTAGDDDYIKGRISKLNKENILDFLNAYYEKAGYVTGGHWGGEGIIEKLDDDTDNTKITKAMKVKFLETVLEKAKDLGLESNEHYIKLQKLLKDHKAYHNNDTNFNATNNDNGFWEEATNYNEAIDVALEALHKEMKTKASA